MSQKIMQAALIGAVALPFSASAAQMTKEELRAYATRELEKCYALQTEALARQCVHDFLTRNVESGDAPSAQASKKFTATQLYRCQIPAFAQSGFTSSIFIWQANGARLAWGKSHTQHFITPVGDEYRMWPVTASGTPGKGTVQYKFTDGTIITVAPNGWTTTNRDKIHNKNSLYGPTSAQPNAPAAQCSRASGNTTQDFTVP